MVAAPMGRQVVMHPQSSLEWQEAERALGVERDVVVRQARRTVYCLVTDVRCDSDNVDV